MNVKNILDDFGKLSGLKINVEKTQVLPINVSPNFAGNIAETGFSIVKNLTILGLDVSENFHLEETNFNKLMVNIRGMSLFWTKFKLLSQIGFFAPVIPFSETQLQTLRNEIGSFVRGSLKTTINMVYNAIHQGG